MQTTYHHKIKQFIASNYPHTPLDDDTNIFGISFISSLFAMQLVQFVEKEMQAQIPREELTLNNFSTINQIAALMSRKANLN